MSTSSWEGRNERHQYRKRHQNEEYFPESSDDRLGHSASMVMIGSPSLPSSAWNSKPFGVHIDCRMLPLIPQIDQTVPRKQIDIGWTCAGTVLRTQEGGEPTKLTRSSSNVFRDVGSRQKKRSLCTFVLR
jgi:hypothetical protein